MVMRVSPGHPRMCISLSFSFVYLSGGNWEGEWKSH